MGNSINQHSLPYNYPIHLKTFINKPNTEQKKKQNQNTHTKKQNNQTEKRKNKTKQNNKAKNKTQTNKTTKKHIHKPSKEETQTSKQSMVVSVYF